MPTYYIRASGGSDSNSGLSFADAWSSLSKVLSMAAGDTLIVCADGVYNLGKQTMSNTGTSRTSPIKIIGGNATGVIDGTVPTVSFPAVVTESVSINTASHFIFTGIRFTGGAGMFIKLGSSFSAGTACFIKCRIDNFSGDGLYSEETFYTKYIRFIYCEIDNNGGNGINCLRDDYGGFRVYYSKIHHNTGDGIRDTTRQNNIEIIGNAIYRNGGDGIDFFDETIGASVNSNVIFSNGGNGIRLLNSTVYGIVCVNNIIRSNGAYGVYVGSGSANALTYIDYNAVSNNTSGQTNISGGTLPGDVLITSDPLFVSEVDGSEDFTLQAGSPCLDVGLGYNG